jgi:hypothetical protein
MATHDAQEAKQEVARDKLLDARTAQTIFGFRDRDQTGGSDYPYTLVWLRDGRHIDAHFWL